eukprot:CAMPEP_0173132704 /NCGR_PEP_ID=MMETSP1105-20130129/301_1 /TAXON_ID=2985 /ORGANISM="Ochromonas sp., Strain BG-1" /LENGTH=101 /DNA_ID=CAMNT_0014044255 /DNA_START=200 /DNA_END=502 /DNA_ORIENTATION=+
MGESFQLKSNMKHEKDVPNLHLSLIPPKILTPKKKQNLDLKVLSLINTNESPLTHISDRDSSSNSPHLGLKGLTSASMKVSEQSREISAKSYEGNEKWEQS